MCTLETFRFRFTGNSFSFLIKINPRLLGPRKRRQLLVVQSAQPRERCQTDQIFLPHTSNTAPCVTRYQPPKTPKSKTLKTDSVKTTLLPDLQTLKNAGPDFTKFSDNRQDITVAHLMVLANNTSVRSQGAPEVQIPGWVIESAAEERGDCSDERREAVKTFGLDVGCSPSITPGVQTSRRLPGTPIPRVCGPLFVSLFFRECGWVCGCWGFGVC